VADLHPSMFIGLIFDTKRRFFAGLVLHLRGIRYKFNRFGEFLRSNARYFIFGQKNGYYTKQSASFNENEIHTRSSYFDTLFLIIISLWRIILITR
jgi:hypothetical protein